jgi:alpha-galactosidase
MGTSLARRHPDWLVGPAGRNWGQQLAGLDLTHPGVRDLLRGRLAWLVALGVDYLKLDFLYAGAVPGPRHDGSDPVSAYRSGLSLVREVVGPDVLLLGSGAPLLPSLGLVDAMRVSPDTFHEGGEDGSAGLRGLMPLAARAWQQGRLWVNDPDCVVARPTYSLREQWAGAAPELGGLASFSDRVAELDEWGLDTVRALLECGGSAAPVTSERLRAAALLAQVEAVS